jgi:alkanesulfonate monooxygenase SsuD/methylene tetrahydromethanopterin reductase-like flavin-dependent oxidoreductase (luciferase family)
VGGAPGGISNAAVRRSAELGDAWHPLGLSLEDLEKGVATMRQMASRAGRQPGVAPRNFLDLTDAPRGSGRAAFQGARDEVLADLRRVKALGAEWMTFDLPRVDVPGMAKAIERIARDIKPAAA